MPKKTGGSRGGASRNRPKAQKNVQLVRPNAVVSENETQQDESSVEEETTLAAPVAKAAAASTATVSKTEAAASKKTDGETVTRKKTNGETISSRKSDEESTVAQTVVEEITPASKGSAAARLAARRQGQAALKPAAPRNVSLITAEHYAYVKRDLIYILILAVIMFSAIIILHFVPAIGG